MKSNLWRIAYLLPRQPGDFELNSLHLYYAGGRIDEGALLTSSHAPAVGTLTDLQQASPGAACVFARESVMSAGFYLQWSFAAEVEIDAFRVAAEGDFPGFVFMAFVAGRWKAASGGVSGADGLTASSLSAVLPLYERLGVAGASLYLPGDSKRDAVTGVDWTLPAGAQIQDDVNRSGLATLMVGLGTSVSYPNAVPEFTNWVGGNLTIEGKVYLRKAATSDAGISLFTYCGDETGSIVYWSFGPNAIGGLVFYFWSGALNLFSTPPGVVPFEQLCDIALVISGTQLRFFVNGSRVHTATRLNTPVGGDNAYPVRINYPGNTGAISTGEFAISDLVYTPSAKYDADYLVQPVWQPKKSIVTLFDAVDVSHSAAVPTFSTRLISIKTARDVEVGGPGTIYGTTKTKGTPSNTPAKARVVLLHQRSKLPVRETWSDPITGAFAFTGIDTTQQFLTLAEDAAGNFRPVAASRLVPEVAP